ncbi:L,D-transpeptidase [uncultured Methylobacterium sp.]|uniref:L,D-transpeptidase family protein n=1 Tax=uncultured Methylobacterium sp. TaxID=157278 RepID=UPI002596BF61|nr:L,D-transpeptidase [uncultured Methylobacterium sp.]
MQNMISRRGFLTALTATAAVGLAGCAAIPDMPVIKVDDNGQPLAPQADVDPAFGSYEAMYAAREDDGYQLPAIPIKRMNKRYLRQVVQDPTGEQPGTIVVDTQNKFLYFVEGDGRAMRYGIGVGREGFTWSGVQSVSKKAEWPDWTPPAEMLARQPYLPRFMAGGDGNPMGARAMYLGSTVYRIHGTNQPSTIGQFVSSGCVGMLNEDVMDLFDRVKVGTRVVVQR